jgi:two-component system OmpR family response regulator
MGTTKDVLIVDDDESVRNLVAAALRRAGLTFDVATDGVHAIEHLAAHAYAVLLLDMMMPRLDGAGVLEEIRALQREDSDRPIVLVMTASTNRDSLVPLAEMVQAVISKPFDVQALGELVQGCVIGRQQHEGRARQSEQR